MDRIGLPIDITDDSKSENDETFRLQISNNNGPTFQRVNSLATITIQDRVTPPPTDPPSPSPEPSPTSFPSPDPDPEGPSQYPCEGDDDDDVILAAVLTFLITFLLMALAAAIICLLIVIFDRRRRDSKKKEQMPANTDTQETYGSQI